MPLSLKLPRRNPDAPRPSLRDRLATLKGSAAKVMRRPPATAIPATPDPIFALIDEQRRLYREHDAAYRQCGHLPDAHPAWEPERAAHGAMWEHWRSVLLKTVPKTAEGCQALAAYGLEFLREQGVDLDVEGPMILDLIARSPLSGRSLDQPTATPAPFDAYDHRTGLVACADATGTVRTKSVAEWVAFMAARLHQVARSERARQFNAACNDLDKAARALLEARLTRELRIDAIHALAHRSDQVFAEAQALRDGGDGAGASAAKVDLTPFTVLQLVHLHEAYKITSHVWEGVGARPYSIASRDARGCVHATMIGRLADFEETRAGLIGNRIVDEITSRSPQNERERDYILSLRLQHEIDCEGRIRDADMMREIAQAWGA